MVLLSFPGGPGDSLYRKDNQGAKGTAFIRDLDAQIINCLVTRNGYRQPAKIEQTYRLQEGEELGITWTKEKEEKTKEVIVMEPSPQKSVFVSGSFIILKLHIACYFLLKLYGDILSTSRFMNVCFSNRSLVTHGKIVRVLEEGVIIRVHNRPKNAQLNPGQSSSSSINSSSPSSLERNDGNGLSIIDLTRRMTAIEVGTEEKTSDVSSLSNYSMNQKSGSIPASPITGTPGESNIESKEAFSSDSGSFDEDYSQEIFISNEDLQFAEVIEDLSLVEPYIQAIMKMISIQPGDEVTIKGKTEHNKMKVRSITVPLCNPFQKKATMDGAQIAFRATNLVPHSRTKQASDNKTVQIRNGQKYKKVFWSKTREDMLGVYLDEDAKTLFAEIIDESNIVGQKRPRVLDCEVDTSSKAQRIV